MTFQQLYEETLVLHGDTNEESYPFDHFARDARDWIAYYNSWLIDNAKCLDAFTHRHDFDILPHSTLREGMNGYMGEYLTPEGFHHEIRLEVDTGDGCPQALPKEKPIENKYCCCNDSLAWDAACNLCKKCNTACCPTYAIEGGCIIFKWIPERRGRAYLWYVGMPAISENQEDSLNQLDLNIFFAALVRLRVIRRYEQQRHGGKYDSFEDKHTDEEIGLFEKRLLSDVNKRCSGGRAGTCVIPISKT